MSTSDVIIASLNEGSHTTRQKLVVLINKSCKPQDVEELLVKLEELISIYSKSNKENQWLLLLQALLESKETRHKVLLTLIEWIRSDKIQDRERFVILAEMHQACLEYDAFTNKDRELTQDLVSFIITPPMSVFKGPDLQITQNVLALLDLVMTIATGVPRHSSNNTQTPNEPPEDSPLLYFTDMPSKDLSGLIVDTIAESSIPTPLLPALLSIVSKLVITSPKSTILGNAVLNLLQQDMKERGGLSPRIGERQFASLAPPNWILVAITKSIFSLIQIPTSMMNNQMIGDSNAATEDDGPSIPPSQLAVAAWLEVLRFVVEISILPWTFSSSTRPHRKTTSQERLELGKSFYDPSLLLCILDVQTRFSIDMVLLILEYYRGMSDATNHQNSNMFSNFKKYGHPILQNSRLHFPSMVIPSQNKDKNDVLMLQWNESSEFGTHDLLILTSLISRTPVRHIVLGLLLDMFAKASKKPNHFSKKSSMIKEICSMEGIGDYVSNLLQLAFHFSQAPTSILAVFGSSAYTNIHQLSKIAYLSIFEHHENHRNEVLILCFSHTFSNPEAHLAPSNSRYHQRQRQTNNQQYHPSITSNRSIGMALSYADSQHDELYCSLFESICHRFLAFLSPFTRKFLEWLPYITHSSSKKVRYCLRMLLAVIPLTQFESSFLDPLIIMLTKQLQSKATSSVTFAMHGLCGILWQHWTPSHVRKELCETLSRSAASSSIARSSLYEALFEVMRPFASSDVQKFTTIYLDLLNYVQALIMEVVGRHWSWNNQDTPNMELETFFNYSPSTQTLVQTDSAVSITQLLFLLHVLYRHNELNSLAVIPSMMEIGSNPGPSGPNRSHQSRPLTSESPLNNVTIDLIACLVNQMTSISYVVGRLLKIPVISSSPLHRKFVQVQQEFSSIDLLRPSQKVNGIRIQHNTNPTNLVNKWNRCEFASSLYLVLSEAMFKEAQLIHNRGFSAFFHSNNAAIACAKAVQLMELRSTILAFRGALSDTDPSWDPNHATLKSISVPVNPNIFSLSSIIILLQKYVLPDPEVERPSFEQKTILSPNPLLQFLPSPSITLVKDALSIILNQLIDCRSKLFVKTPEDISKIANQSLKQRQDSGSVESSDATSETNKKSNIIPFDEFSSNAEPNYDFFCLSNFRSLLRVCFQCFLIVISIEPDIDLNPHINLYLELLQSHTPVTLAADSFAESKSLLVRIFEHLFSIIAHMKWNWRITIDEALGELVRDVMDPQSSKQEGQTSSNTNEADIINATNGSDIRKNQSQSLQPAPKSFNKKRKKQMAADIESGGMDMEVNFDDTDIEEDDEDDEDDNYVYDPTEMDHDDDNELLLDYAEPGGTLALLSSFFLDVLFMELRKRMSYTHLNEYISLLGTLIAAKPLMDSGHSGVICDELLTSLTTFNLSQSFVLKLLFNFVLQHHSSIRSSIMMATSIIELCTTPERTLPRVRSQTRERNFMELLSVVNFTENATSRITLLEMAISFISSIFVRKSCSSDSKIWSTYVREHQLISFALRHMALFGHQFEFPLKVWNQFVACSIRFISTTCKYLFSELTLRPQALQRLVLPPDPWNDSNVDSWDAEYWIFSIMFFPGSLRALTKKLATMFSGQRENRLPMLTSRIDYFEITAERFSNRLKPALQSQIRACLEISDNTGMHKMEIGSDSSGEDEDSESIAPKPRKKRVAVTPMRSANSFIDDALRSEEIYFQDEDDYADLENWIDTS